LLAVATAEGNRGAPRRPTPAVWDTDWQFEPDSCSTQLALSGSGGAADAPVAEANAPVVTTFRAGAQYLTHRRCKSVTSRCSQAALSATHSRRALQLREQPLREAAHFLVVVFEGAQGDGPHGLRGGRDAEHVSDFGSRGYPLSALATRGPLRKPRTSARASHVPRSRGL
jgi:hypothetical protein